MDATHDEDCVSKDLESSKIVYAGNSTEVLSKGAVARVKCWREGTRVRKGKTGHVNMSSQHVDICNSSFEHSVILDITRSSDPEKSKV